MPAKKKTAKQKTDSKRDQGVWTEEVKVKGEKLLEEIKKIIYEGNVRQIAIKQKGKTILVIPLTIGVVAAAILPQLAAIGAIAAVVTDCSIEVEKIKK